MKNKSLLQLMLIVTMLSVTSCTFLAKIVYGFKDPEFESSASIDRKQTDYFGPDHRSLVYSFEAWREKEFSSVPEIYVFDRQGKYVPYKDSLRPNCNGPADSFASELDPAKAYLTDDAMSLEKFLQYTNMPGCGLTPQLPDEDVDFTVMMSWAAYAGKKIYKEKTILWLDKLKKNNKIKYRVYLVNKDLQECWSEDQKNKLTTAR
jgi:hypothetical protein